MLTDRDGFIIETVDYVRAEVITDDGEIFGLDPMACPRRTEPFPPASAVDPERCVNPWHTAGGELRRLQTCPECPSRY